MRRLAVLFTISLCSLFPVLNVARADSVVVFNEIMYHPATNEAALEWVELYNQMAVDVEIGSWSIQGAVQYQFPAGTIIPGGGYLVIAASPLDLAALSGITNLCGPFTGRLGNGGQTLELRNNSDRLMDTVSYGTDGDWPVAPDGSGVSLAKRDQDLGSALAANWVASNEVGGSPGRQNFPRQTYVLTNNTPLILYGAWKYNDAGNDLGTNWRSAGFNDTDWTSGAAFFQAGPVPGTQAVASVFSSGLGTNGVVMSPGTADPHYWLTISAQSTPPPPDISATVISNHPSWLTNDATSSWLGPVNPGSTSVAAGRYNYRTLFSLDGYNPASMTLFLNMAVDNRITNVVLNGALLGISNAGFSAAVLGTNFVVTNGFVAGTNTLDFLTINDGTSANPGGFRAKLAGYARLTNATQLASGRTTYYFRTQFAFSGSPELASLKLSTALADGAIFYLNGTEVLRLNLPADTVTSSTYASSNVPSPTMQGPLTLPSAYLASGTNVLAVEVHSASGVTNDVWFGASLAIIQTNSLALPPFALAFNEITSATNTNFWVELINYGTTNLNLGGCTLLRQGSQTNREYVFPSQVLAPGTALQVTRDTLGFAADPGDQLFLYRPGRTNVLDAVVAKHADRARWPDGAGQWRHPSLLTPGSSNVFQFHKEIVINEIMYHAPGASSEAWVELYNRSNNAVDLTGWRLDSGVSYAFDVGTLIPAGGYLVVANDPVLMRSNYPGITVVGPYSGKLSGHGDTLTLKDANDNPVNEVRYFDGGRWPSYADGGGASLELKDPWADNTKPEVWASSIESGHSSWSNYTYSAMATNVLGPTNWNEFVLGLLDTGECLLDDLHVVESPDTSPVELLQNGDFETGLSAWRILGTHSHSTVETDPDNAANHVLHLVATGPTGHMHNHLETTLANTRAVTNGRVFRISFRAKWLAGNNRLNTRLYFNRAAKTTVLPMAAQHGTPGARNSTYVSNLGPTFGSFSHSPVVPQPGEAVTISATASDPQGISQMKLWWATNGGAWQSSVMSPATGSTEWGYTNYAATLSGMTTGTLVQFYIQATDALGATATFPAEGTNSRALFRVDEGKSLMSQLHRFRLLMLPAEADLLHAHTNVMSNDRVKLTVVYDEREVFYNVGLHLQSSERGRDVTTRVGYTVQFPLDHLFRGVHDGFSMDRSGGYSGLGGKHDEIILWHAINHAGNIPGMYNDLAQVFAPRTSEDGTAMLRMASYGPEFLGTQYKNGADGALYKMELIYYPSNSATGDPQAPKLPQPDGVLGVEIKDWGDDVENYRWVFLQDNHADVDDYSQIVALNKAFSLTGTALDTQTRQLMDVDQWMRTLAYLALVGAGDIFSYGNNHNFLIYFRPEDGKALAFPFDMDYGEVKAYNYAFPGNSSANTYKINMLPNNYRCYYEHLLDITTSTMNSAYLSSWGGRYAGLLGQNWTSLVNYLDQRATYVRSTMPLNTTFGITNNAGLNFSTTNNYALLSGNASLTVKFIEINGIRYPLSWTNLTNWSILVPLVEVTNRLTAQGVDAYGNRLTNATASITVTNLGLLAPRPVVINEWMADNGGPGGYPDPLDGAFQDWFELFNPNYQSVDLSGFTLTDTLTEPAKWTIPTNTVIGPRSFLVVWADNDTTQNGQGTNRDLHANFKLNNSGEVIAMFSTNGTLQHVVTFGQQYQNVSQGLYPDGNTNTYYFMTNWSPNATNRLGAPPSPNIATTITLTNGAFSFGLPAILGRAYRVEYRNNLGTNVWIPYATNRSYGGDVSVTDAIGGRKERYYRVVILP
ncbi:MAG: lamin tail domain-containing protein [Verrucomicrobiota bacterium]